MSADSQAFDPYCSPSMPEGPYAGKTVTGRPGWLTMLCVLCIVLGGLGLANAIFSAAGLAGGKSLQKWVQPKGGASGMPQEMEEAQKKLQDDMYAVQDKYFWFIVPSVAGRFFVAILLLVAGIRALSMNEGGRKLLLMACAIAVVFEFLTAILGAFVAMEQLTASNSYIEKMTSSIPKDKANAAKVMEIAKRVGQVISVVAVVFAGLVVLLKIALYTFGIVYLQKPHIRALFGPVQSPVSNVPSHGP